MINPFNKKKGLGRGLSSLIGDNDVTKNNNLVSISSIIPNKFQPRKKFDQDSLEDLTKSIKERGVIQPLIVRNSKRDEYKFELIAGERRLQAAQKAGLHEVPIVVIEANDLKSLELAIIENVQRNDLNPIEEANGYKRLIEEFSYDQEQVSKFIGKSRSHISNSLRLLNLPKNVLNLIEEGRISQGHAKVLVGLENSYFIARKIVDKNLSVRQAENLIKAIKNPKKNKNNIKDPNIMNLEKSLEDKTGINVNIKNSKNKNGQLTFNYKDPDQLNRLITVIKAHY